MSMLNKNAADGLKGLDIHAVTDVTGFGLLGHLAEVCKGSNVSAEIYFSKLIFSLQCAIWLNLDYTLEEQRETLIT